MSRIFSSAEPGPQLTWTAMIEDISPLAMPISVTDDRPFSLEPMRQCVSETTLSIDFLYAVLEQYREVLLQELQFRNGSLDSPQPTSPLGDIERLVLIKSRLLVDDVGKR